MSERMKFLVALIFIGFLMIPGQTLVQAQQESRAESDSSQAARDLFNNKCFQCHGNALWKNLKRNEKEWKGIIYRMVGRGALWTEEEINTMAEYLAQTKGKSDD